MPKKPKQKGDLTILREALDLSQAQFASRLGVSASLIKKVEAGKRAMAQDLASRVFAETGVIFLEQNTPQAPLVYSNEMYQSWHNEVQFNEKSAQVAARLVLKLVELMLASSARPGVKKTFQTWNAIIQALNTVKNELHLEKHIDAELKARNSTETKQYTVRELRDNDLLARMVDFRDDPRLLDDDKLTLSKTTGWLPAREVFNIWWHHREFLAQVAQAQENGLTDEAKAKLAEHVQAIEHEIDQEADKFLGRIF